MPPPPPSAAADDGELSAATIRQMGFEAAAVEAALASSGGDPMQALEKLLAADEEAAIVAQLEQEAQERNKFCQHCGNPLRGGPFCADCGAPVAGGAGGAGGACGDGGGGGGPTSGVACPVSSGGDSSASASASASASSAEVDLNFIVSLLETSLGLGGGELQVIDDACVQLDVPKRRGTLKDRAIKCWEKLGKPTTAVAAPGQAGNIPIAMPVSEDEAARLANGAGSRAGGGSSSSSGGGGGSSSSSSGPLAPWSCAACTYAHDTPANMGFLACELCGTPRP